jgi:hypothetical protein
MPSGGDSQEVRAVAATVEPLDAAPDRAIFERAVEHTLACAPTASCTAAGA